MTRARELVIATRNEGKKREIRRILGKGLRGVSLLSLNDFPRAPEVKETESTLEGNAALKAKSAAKFTGKPALADDSGLFVSALGGRPGVKSARYAGPAQDFAANRKKLLREMNGKKARGAAFRAAMALATPDGKVVFSRGIVRGRIIREERGRHGFGYDPVFVPCGYGRTFAELGPKVKNRISHRALALKRIAPAIRRLW